jgi:hypothetical protein
VQKGMSALPPKATSNATYGMSPKPIADMCLRIVDKLSTIRSHGQCRSGTRQLDRLRFSNVLGHLFLPGSELLLRVKKMLLLGGELLHPAL